MNPGSMLIKPPPSSSSIEQFDPGRHRLNIAALDYGIEEAKRIRDWPVLEKAVDEKLTEQIKFVAWWKGHVTGQGTRTDLNRDPGESLPMRKAEEVTGMKQQRVADLRKRLRKPDKYRQHLLGTEYFAAFLAAVSNLRGTTGTGQNEWFTPAKYIELAREVLGEIDLDPATHPHAQKTIRARKFYTAEDDGLAHEWHGRVWLNPPYAQPWVAQFASKMVEEFCAGRVSSAIVLTHNYTDTEWFHHLANHCAAICFSRGRIRFEDEDGNEAAPTQGQAFFYFGNLPIQFKVVFEGVGFVMTR
jgi:phage N-6-adenine-methyltransferase